MNRIAGIKPTTWLLILILIILHQDYWNWSNASLWFGFLPAQMGYHIVISLLAAGFWWWLVHFDWPPDHDSWKSEGDA